MTAPFACISTAVLSPKVIKVIGTSPLTLLVYLHRLTDYGTGKRTKPYDHATAARELGISERTVNRYFKALVKARLVTATRHAHGLDFAVVHRDPASRSEAPESALHRPDEPTELSVHEPTESAPQPSRGKNPDSESPNQSPPRGGRKMVGGRPPVAQPAALAPPDVETLAPFRETLREVATTLHGELDAGLLHRTAEEVRRLTALGTPVPGIRAALLVAAGDIARHRWGCTPAVWSGRIRKAAAASAAGPDRVSGSAAVAAAFARQGVPRAPGIDEEMRRVALR